MKEIVIISGKGGTGKTSVTAAFASFAKKEAILADCDVDASNLHLVMHPETTHREEFYSGELAEIDPKQCISCGKCFEVCRFNAVKPGDEFYSIDEINCEGCGYCSKICPSDAITMKPQKSGNVFHGDTDLTAGMVYAKLDIGADNSGKLVAKVKKDASAMAEAREKDLILVDGSPGIGCPVVSSLSGAAYVIIVTEPSVSGYHDLERVIELIKKFRLPAGCIINKRDLNENISKEIKEHLVSQGVTFLADIPYSDAFSSAIKEGVPVTSKMDNTVNSALKEAWEKVLQEIKL